MVKPSKRTRIWWPSWRSSQWIIFPKERTERHRFTSRVETCFFLNRKENYGWSHHSGVRCLHVSSQQLRCNGLVSLSTDVISYLHRHYLDLSHLTATTWVLVVQFFSRRICGSRHPRFARFARSQQLHSRPILILLEPGQSLSTCSCAFIYARVFKRG